MKAPSPFPARSPVLVLVHDAATKAVLLELLAPLAPAILAENTAEAEVMLRHETYGVLIVEDELPLEPGIMFLARINNQHPTLRRILICTRPDPELLVFLINEANVFRCVPKPVDPVGLRAMVVSALTDHVRARRLSDTAADHERLRAELAEPGFHSRRRLLLVRHWVTALPKLFMFSLFGAAWVFVLGVVVLLALYGLKTIAGIDLLDGMHLRDLWR